MRNPLLSLLRGLLGGLLRLLRGVRSLLGGLRPIDAADPRGVGELGALDARRAARRPRHASEGFPSVSTDAIIRPPMRLRSVRKSRRCCALRSGSDSVQNRWPPRLPRTTVQASADEATLGILPLANSRSPPIWTPALRRASVKGSCGTFVAAGSGSFRSTSTVGRAASAARWGLRSASIPWPTNTADRSGHATLRINMPV